MQSRIYYFISSDADVYYPKYRIQLILVPVGRYSLEKECVITLKIGKGTFFHKLNDFGRRPVE